MSLYMHLHIPVKQHIYHIFFFYIAFIFFQVQQTNHLTFDNHKHSIFFFKTYTQTIIKRFNLSKYLLS